MWDNFARLTARLAKSRVLFNNLTIYLDFSAIFSRIAPNRPLTEGRHLGATFCRRGATFWLGLQRYATASNRSRLNPEAISWPGGGNRREDDISTTRYLYSGTINLILSFAEGNRNDQNSIPTCNKRLSRTSVLSRVGYHE